MEGSNNQNNPNKQNGYNYQKVFDGVIFDKDLVAKHFVCCTFNSCNFLKCNPNEILALLNSNNVLNGCWFDPTLAFAWIIDSLHRDVNIVDAINKALTRVDGKSIKPGRQLVLIDIDQIDQK